MDSDSERIEDRQDPKLQEEGATAKNNKLLLVNDEHLGPLESRPPLTEYLVQLYQRRHFIYLDARSRAFNSNRDLLLGQVWTIGQPLLNAAMYGFMFGFILKTSHGIENFVGYLILGITFFGFLTDLLNSGTTLIRSSRGMITSFSFPKAALVVATSYRKMLDSLPQAAVAVAIALLGQLGTQISWKMLLVIPLFFLLHIFGTGLMFLSARVTAQIPDLRMVIQLASRAWFFLSGVFFSIERFVDQPELRSFMEANPAYIFLQAIRGAVMYHETPDLQTWLTLISWSMGALVVGFLLFWQAEDKYVNVK